VEKEKSPSEGSGNPKVSVFCIEMHINWMHERCCLFVVFTLIGPNKVLPLGLMAWHEGPQLGRSAKPAGSSTFACVEHDDNHKQKRAIRWCRHVLSAPAHPPCKFVQSLSCSIILPSSNAKHP